MHLHLLLHLHLCLLLHHMKFTCTCRDEKVKVLKAVQKLRLEDVVLGQVGSERKLTS